MPRWSTHGVHDEEKDDPRTPRGEARPSVGIWVRLRAAGKGERAWIHDVRAIFLEGGEEEEEVGCEEGGEGAEGE